MPAYMNIHPEGQIDATMCWGACLSWWMRAVKHTHISQSRLQKRHEKIWNDNGTMSESGLKKIIKDARYGMGYNQCLNASQFTAETLQEHLSYGPVYIGFTETSSQKQHVNVIYAMSGIDNNAQVCVMEPQAVAINDNSGFPSGIWRGQHQRKILSEFNTFGSIYYGSLKVWS